MTGGPDRNTERGPYPVASADSQTALAPFSNSGYSCRGVVFKSCSLVGMKTIQISDGLWKRLKLESVERGVSMREMVEEMGAAWMSRSAAMDAQVGPGPVTSQRLMESLRGSAPRELKVELEE